MSASGGEADFLISAGRCLEMTQSGLQQSRTLSSRTLTGSIKAAMLQKLDAMRSRWREPDLGSNRQDRTRVGGGTLISPLPLWERVASRSEDG
jgi:hypothetical protein